MENKGKSVKVEDLQNERVEDSFDSIQYERVEDSFDGLQSDTNIALQEDKMQKHGDCVEASSKATKTKNISKKLKCMHRHNKKQPKNPPFKPNPSLPLLRIR